MVGSPLPLRGRGAGGEGRRIEMRQSQFGLPSPLPRPLSHFVGEGRETLGNLQGATSSCRAIGAGYATDPAYGEKLVRIMKKVST